MNHSVIVARLVLLLALWLSLPGAAQEPQAVAKGTRAVALGQHALDLYERGKWAEALAVFRRADALYHSPVFILYAARCLRNTDRLLRARALFRGLLVERFGPAPPLSWHAARRDAQAELAAVEAEVPSLIVSVTGAFGIVELTVDGRPAHVDQVIELDPGLHQIVARDRARYQRRMVTTVRGVKRRRLTVGFAGLAVPPRGAHPALLGPLLTAGGGLLLIAGSVLGVMTLGRAQETREALPEHQCVDRTCPVSRKSIIESQISSDVQLGTASAVLLVGGLISVTAGVLLWLKDGGDGQQDPHKLGRLPTTLRVVL